MRIKAFNLSYGQQIFKALSDDARVRILHLLYRNGKMCISDIEQILDFTQTKTSRHIAYLKNAGLLYYKKKDQWVYYSIKDEVMDILGTVIGYLEKDLTLMEDQKNFNTLYANNILAIRKLHNTQSKYKLSRDY